MSVYTNPDFRQLPDEVAALFADAGERSFFAQAAWYDILTRHGLPSGTGVRLYVDGESPCRAALLCQVVPEDGPHAERRLRSLSSAYSCEHGPLFANDCDPAASVTRILEAIYRERPVWEAVTLAALDPADPGFRALARGFRAAGMSVKPFFDSGTWYEETDGLSFADYLTQRPSALRNTWRRKSAKLRRSGRLRSFFYDGSSAIDQGIADYETIYRASWKKSEPFPDFMPNLIRLVAGLGALRLGVLHVDGEPAAAQFWILWRGKACIYKLAHDERFDDLSLGTYLTMEMTERVLETDKPWEINLGRGDDPYKKLWLPKRRERWGLVAANPRTLRGLGLSLRQLAARAVRPLRPGEPVPPPI